MRNGLFIIKAIEEQVQWPLKQKGGNNKWQSTKQSWW